MDHGAQRLEESRILIDDDAANLAQPTGEEYIVLLRAGPDESEGEALVGRATRIQEALAVGILENEMGILWAQRPEGGKILRPFASERLLHGADRHHHKSWNAARGQADVVARRPVLLRATVICLPLAQPRLGGGGLMMRGCGGARAGVIAGHRTSTSGRSAWRATRRAPGAGAAPVPQVASLWAREPYQKPTRAGAIRDQHGV